MIIILILLLFVFTFFIASDIVFMVISHFLKPADHSSVRHIFFLSRGVGPVLISWVLYNSFVLFPGRPAWLYILIVLSVFTFLYFLSRKKLSDLVKVYQDLFRAILNFLRHLTPLSGLILGLTVFIVLFIIIIGVAFPIVSHDSLVYAIEGKIMYRDKSLDNYLAVVEPDPYSGFYQTDFQTPFLQMLYVWFFLGLGSNQHDILVRAVAPIYALHSLLLVGYLVYRYKSRLDAFLAMFVLAITPLFVAQSFENGQDAPRLYLAFVALVWFAELIDESHFNRRKMALIAGFSGGIAIYAHLLGAPVIVMGIILYFVLARAELWQKMTHVFIISIAVVLSGAIYHYLLNPLILEAFMRQFSLGFLYEWLLLLFPNLKPPEAIQPATAQFANLLEVRGQGDSPLAQLIFGRLQMFTGIESFGLVFYFFWAAIIVWLLGSSKTTLEKLFVATALLYAVVVLSGIRKVSWSNPRYIGSLLFIAAYFAGPFLASLIRRISGWRIRPLASSMMIIILVFPLLLVLTIRGAKVGITNQGNFYSDFRSLTWVRATLTHPQQSIEYFWDNYVGIRKTVKYFFASDDIKLLHAHDYFATVEYINTHADQNERALVFRNGRYFYYAERKGVWWEDPNIYWYQRLDSKEEVYELLSIYNINYVLIDSFLETYPAYAQTKLVEVIADPDLSELVYEYGSAKVYKLVSASPEVLAK